MNRVLRSPPTASAPRWLGPAGASVLAPEVQAAIDQAATAAHERGFAAGRALGRREGREASAAIVAAVRGVLEDAVAAMRQERVDAAAALTDDVLAVAEHVMGHLPHDGGSALRSRLADVLAQLDDEALTIAVHPDDRDAVAGAVGPAHDATVVADPALAPGEAAVRGAWARADLTRRAALAAIREAAS